VNQSKILEELGIKPSEGKEKEEKGLSPSVPSSLPLKAGEIGAKEAYDLMRSYMERYGLTRESLLVLSSTVLLLSSISIAVAFRTVVAQHRDEIEVIRSVGASKRILKADILVKLLPWAAAASLTGLLLAVLTLNLIQRAGFLQVLSHSPSISVDPLIFLLNFLFVLLLMLASLRGDIN
jgi:predicted lysophospholipase L1 biosynthesis ABC-type transport system permease subunit